MLSPKNINDLVNRCDICWSRLSRTCTCQACGMQESPTPWIHSSQILTPSRSGTAPDCGVAWCRCSWNWAFIRFTSWCATLTWTTKRQCWIRWPCCARWTATREQKSNSTTLRPLWQLPFHGVAQGPRRNCACCAGGNGGWGLQVVWSGDLSNENGKDECGVEGGRSLSFWKQSATRVQTRNKTSDCQLLLNPPPNRGPKLKIN